MLTVALAGWLVLAAGAASDCHAAQEPGSPRPNAECHLRDETSMLQKSRVVTSGMERLTNSAESRFPQVLVHTIGRQEPADSSTTSFPPILSTSTTGTTNPVIGTMTTDYPVYAAGSTSTWSAQNGSTESPNQVRVFGEMVVPPDYVPPATAAATTAAATTEAATTMAVDHYFDTTTAAASSTNVAQAEAAGEATTTAAASSAGSSSGAGNAGNAGNSGSSGGAATRTVMPSGYVMGDPTYNGCGNGAPCVFPYIYEGKTYTDCTDKDQTPGEVWCATTLQPDGLEADDWGFCFEEGHGPGQASDDNR